MRTQNKLKPNWNEPKLSWTKRNKQAEPNWNWTERTETEQDELNKQRMSWKEQENETNGNELKRAENERNWTQNETEIRTMNETNVKRTEQEAGTGW